MIMVGLELDYHLFQRSKINVSFQSQDLKTISLQISDYLSFVMNLGLQIDSI